MASHEESAQPQQVYDILHWAAVMQGVEEPNEADVLRALGGRGARTELQPRPRPHGLFHAGDVQRDVHGITNDLYDPMKYYSPCGMPDGPGPAPQPSCALSSDSSGEVMASVEVDGYTFRSGYRIISGQAPVNCKKAQSSPEEATDNGEGESVSPSQVLKCDYPGCTSKSTFKRKYELVRHRNRHTKHPDYFCPAATCPRRVRGFHRADNRQAHLSKCHGEGDIFQCASPGCKQTVEGLHLYCIHFMMHPYLNQTTEVWERITFGWSCPIPNCELHDRLLFIWQLRNHVQMNHGDAERQAHADTFRAIGMNWKSLDACCPVCGLECPRDSLWWWRDHFLSDHGVLDQQHLQAWNDAVAANSRESVVPKLSEEDVREHLRHGLLSPQRRAAELGVLCPHCRVYHGRPPYYRTNSYDNMLHLDPSILLPHRGVIYRLSQDLVDDPLFDDLKPAKAGD